jgi:hypothetical protein
MARVAQEVVIREGVEVKIPSMFNTLSPTIRAKMIESYIADFVAASKQDIALKAVTVLNIDDKFVELFNAATGLKAERKVSNITDKASLVVDGQTIFKGGRTWEDAVNTVSETISEYEKALVALKAALPYAQKMLNEKAKELEKALV